MALVDDLISHEGWRNHLYKCPADKWTIGVGYNIEERGLPDYIITLLLNDTIEESKRELGLVFDPWTGLSQARQEVLINMMFNLGRPRFSKFVKFWAAMEKQDYETAADEMLDSKWAKQVRNRAIELADKMRVGV